MTSDAKATRIESEDNVQNPSESTEDVKEIKKIDQIALYSRTVANSTSRGLVQPFVSMIALTMGASSGLLGWIQSISNLLSTFLGPVFGRLSDIVQKRIPFIVVSTLSWGIPYAFLYFITPDTAWLIVIIVAVVNLLMSLGIPTFTALQNELFPKEVRGKLTGRIFWFDAIGSMVATLFTGIVLTSIFYDNDYQKYILIPVAIGFVLSLIGVIPFKNVEEPLRRNNASKNQKTISLKESFKKAYRNKPFAKFTLISMIQSLFFSFAWPLFSIFQVNVLKATAFEVAILSISFSVAILLVINIGAKLSDRIGRTKLIFFNRIALALFPLAYIFATEVWHLYIIHFTIAPLIFLGTASLQAYLLDMVPRDEGGMYFGIYNMMTGVTLFIGALAGGYLTEGFLFILNENSIATVITSVQGLGLLVTQTTISLLTSTTPLLVDTLRIAVVISLAIVTAGRIVTSFPFLTLKEMKKFPSSWSEVRSQLTRRRKIQPPV